MMDGRRQKKGGKIKENCRKIERAKKKIYTAKVIKTSMRVDFCQATENKKGARNEKAEIQNNDAQTQWMR